MPGEFYEEAKQQKLDLTEIKNLNTTIQNLITQVQNSITQIQNNITNVQNNITNLVEKSEGIPPTPDSTTANWQNAETEVVTIGAHDKRYKVQSLLLGIQNLVGTIITVRMYMRINGTERKVYDQPFDATTDPTGLWIIDGTVGIHEVLRVTLQSNNATDNGKAVDYDYMLESMD